MVEADTRTMRHRRPSMTLTMINALALGYLLWTLMDHDGWGRARLYLYTARVSRDTAETLGHLHREIGKAALAAEAAYYREVDR